MHRWLPALIQVPQPHAYVRAGRRRTNALAFPEIAAVVYTVRTHCVNDNPTVEFTIAQRVAVKWVDGHTFEQCRRQLGQVVRPAVVRSPEALHGDSHRRGAEAGLIRKKLRSPPAKLKGESAAAGTRGVD